MAGLRSPQCLQTKVFAMTDTLIEYNSAVFQVGMQSINSNQQKVVHNKSYCEKYGRLYTWDVITPEPVGEHDLGITPAGWHIPSEAEWEELVKTLGGEKKVAEMIRVGGPTGFNAYLSGGSDFKSDYLNLDKSAMFWSSTVVNDDQVYRMGINDKGKWVKRPAFKEARLHIRCVKDKN